MRVGTLVAIALVTGMLGCNSNSPTVPSTPSAGARQYNGTASVGDFFTITLDPNAHSLTYADISNGSSGTVAYSANSDGTYSLSDSSGNLIAAYEVPDYALLLQAAKTGPNHDVPALITAVAKGSISVATWAGQGYNYMQFRTASGGIEVGSADVDSTGNVTTSSYWPYGSMNQNGTAFNHGGFDVAQFQQDSSGTFLKLADENGSYDYIFGTANGVFAVDTPSGAILGLKKNASKDFSAAFAGTYKAIYYEKTGAATGPGNLETGSPGLDKGTLIVSSDGQVTAQDSLGGTIFEAALTPVADASYLYGSGKLQDPCYGVFTFRITTADSQQDVFATFMDRAVLFSSFRADLPWGSGNTYDYMYGVGLK